MSPDESMDDWYADGYAQEREDARTARYRVTFEVEYDPEQIDDIERWGMSEIIPARIINPGENIAITDVKIEEVQK